MWKLFKYFKLQRNLLNSLPKHRVISTNFGLFKNEDICAPYSPEIPIQGEDVNKCDKVAHRMKDLIDIRCKSVLITGGAGGIGFETAKALMKAHVLFIILADINRKAGEEAVKTLQDMSDNHTISFVKCDVSSLNSFENAFKEAEDVAQRVDILINNAAIFNETPDQWEKTIEVNMMGTVNGMVLGLKHMVPSTDSPSRTCIVNVGSKCCLEPYVTMPVYTASKLAVLGLTGSFAQHYKKTNIRCISVCPGRTDTNIMPTARDFVDLHYKPEWGEKSESTYLGVKGQPVGVVGESIVHAIKYGPNGVTYVVDNGQLFRYNIPDYRTVLKQEAILF